MLRSSPTVPTTPYYKTIRSPIRDATENNMDTQANISQYRHHKSLLASFELGSDLDSDPANCLWTGCRTTMLTSADQVVKSPSCNHRSHVNLLVQTISSGFHPRKSSFEDTTNCVGVSILLMQGTGDSTHSFGDVNTLSGAPLRSRGFCVLPAALPSYF